MPEINVLIIGAGSIGNHLANAARQKKWLVSMYDKDLEALRRTKNQIYPDRYKKWDDSIKLLNEFPSKKNYNVVFIGTPPNTHIEIAIKIIEDVNPQVLMIEKPLSPPFFDLSPFLEKCNISNTKVLVGFNHNLTENTNFAENLIDEGVVGYPISLHVRWLEHWGGIFGAHPWLSGPKDSYLGYYKKGGGACGEHSHAISIWQHFSSYMGCGLIDEVSATMDLFEKDGLEYDQSSVINVRSRDGLFGTIIQDVITEPAQKTLRIQGSKGFIEWYVNFDHNNDAVKYGDLNGKFKLKLFKKSRPDDFKGEINHIEKLLKDSSIDSPLSLERGIETMKVIEAAFKSQSTFTSTKIN